MPAQSLKTLVVIDDPSPEHWVLELLTRLDNHRYIEIVSVQLVGNANNVDIAPFNKHGFNSRLTHLIVKRCVNTPRFTDTNNKTSPPTPKLRDAPDNTNIDVILYLACLRATDLTTLPDAKYGIWHAHHETLYASTLNCLLENTDTHTLTLWRYSNRAAQTNPDLLAKHALPVQSFSIDDLTQAAYASLPALFESRLNWLVYGKDTALYEQEQSSLDCFHASLPPTQLSSSAGLTFKAIKLLLRFYKKRIRNRFTNEQWQLAYARNHVSACLQMDQSTNDYQSLEPPVGCMWADPHVLQLDAATYVYFEELDFRQNKGRIAVAALADDGFEEGVKTALEKDYHLSYPFVFSHDAQHYMIPESSASNAISLYRCSHLPDQWEFVEHLVEGVNAADSTLIFHQGLWWLFSSGMSHPLVDERDQLLAWYSPSLLDGRWQPHPMNPLVTGVDRARMAGPLFSEGDVLYRPSQYGAVRYGYGINLSRIDSLTPEDYSETLIKRQFPKSNSPWLASHTFTKMANLTVIDRMKLVKKTR